MILPSCPPYNVQLSGAKLPELLSRRQTVGAAMIQKITKASGRIALACTIALASSGAALAHATLHHASPEAGMWGGGIHVRL